MKDMINRVIERAMADADRKANESRLPENVRNLQQGFTNDPLLSGNESFAALVGLITGFRPRTTNQKVVPFEVFAVMSKAEQRVVKYAMCVACLSGASYAVTHLSEGAVMYADDTCRAATKDEAEAFVKDVVSGWNDEALMGWIIKNLGNNYVLPFMTELGRGVAAHAKK